MKNSTVEIQTLTDIDTHINSIDISYEILVKHARINLWCNIHELEILQIIDISYLFSVFAAFAAIYLVQSNESWLIIWIWIWSQ